MLYKEWLVDCKNDSMIHSFWAWTRIIAQKKNSLLLVWIMWYSIKLWIEYASREEIKSWSSICCIYTDYVVKWKIRLTSFLHLLRYEMKKTIVTGFVISPSRCPRGISLRICHHVFIAWIHRTYWLCSNTCKYNSIYCNVICYMLNGKRARGRKKRTEKISCVRRMDIVTVDIHTFIRLSCHDSARKTQN